MQEFIYSYLFSRTLSDLDELLNIADDDRKDCLWEVRRRLLTAKTGPPATASPKKIPAWAEYGGNILYLSTRCRTPDVNGWGCHHHSDHKGDHFYVEGEWKPEETGPPQTNGGVVCDMPHGGHYACGAYHVQPETTRTSEVAPKGPAEKVTPKFQENCKDSVKVGRPEIGLYEPAAVYIDRVVAWERAKRATPAGNLTPTRIDPITKTVTVTATVEEPSSGLLSTPPHQDVAPSHRILFAGPGECLICSTCLHRITDRDVEEMGKNHDAEAYFCQRCIDFVEVRIRRLSTEEELDIETARLRKVWEEDKQRRDVHEAAVAAGRPFSAAREFMKKVDKIRTILSEPIKGTFHPVTTYLDPMGVYGTPIILPTSMKEESRTVAPTPRSFPEGPELDMIPVCNV